MAIHYVPTQYNVMPTLGFTRTAGQVITWMAWGHPDSVGGAHKGMFGSRNGSCAGDIMKVEKHGDWSIEYDPIGCGGAVAFAGGLEACEWDNIIGRYDGCEINMFENGACIASVVCKPCAFHDQDAWSIGLGGGSGSWDGDIAHSVIWLTALSDNQIGGLGRGANPFAVGGLIHWWPDYGDNVTTFPDFSSGRKNGSNVGCPTKFAGNPPMEQLENFL